MDVQSTWNGTFSSKLLLSSDVTVIGVGVAICTDVGSFNASGMRQGHDIEAVIHPESTEGQKKQIEGSEKTSSGCTHLSFNPHYLFAKASRVQTRTRMEIGIHIFSSVDRSTLISHGFACGI